jgi:hypothetical protein
MKATRRFAITLAVLTISSAPALAQYSKVGSLITTASGFGDTIRDLSSRQPLDEPKIYYNAQKMREAAKAAVDALAGFGDPLAGAALSPHETMLREPGELAKKIAYWLGDREMIDRCNQMEKLINTPTGSRSSDFDQTVKRMGSDLYVLGQARMRDWEDFTRKCDQTRRWLGDNLKNATSERDRSMQDCRPIEEAQNTAWTRLQNAQRADDKADYDHDRALERVVSGEAKENDCYERYRDAVARGAKSEDAWALRQRWAYAANEQNDALSAAFSALQTLNSAREELSRAYVQLAAAQRELRQFTAATNADKIVENYNNFVRWVELFEREMGR